MLKRIGVVALTWLLWLATSPGALAVPYTGTLDVTFFSASGGTPTTVALPLAGGIGAGTSTPGAITLTAPGITGAAPAFPFMTPFGGLGGIAVPSVMLSLGSFAAGAGPGGGFGGPAPLLGSLMIGAFGLPGGTPPPAISYPLPLSPVGVTGGVAMATGPPAPAGGATLTGTGWTTGVATLALFGNTATTVPFRTAVATGADLRTPAGGGTIVLVSPAVVSAPVVATAGGGPPGDKFGMLFTLTLEFPTTSSTTTTTFIQAWAASAAIRTWRAMASKPARKWAADLTPI